MACKRWHSTEWATSGTRRPYAVTSVMPAHRLAVWDRSSVWLVAPLSDRLPACGVASSLLVLSRDPPTTALTATTATRCFFQTPRTGRAYSGLHRFEGTLWAIPRDTFVDAYLSFPIMLPVELGTVHVQYKQSNRLSI